MAPRLTHLNARGEAHMVAVDAKAETAREAVAAGAVYMRAATIKALRAGTLAKGDALAVARIAGIQGAKRASELIPLCHPLRLTGVDVALVLRGARTASRVEIVATVRAHDRTGVEMEALAAVSAAALTLYDMCKAIDKAMVIGDISVRQKRGGRSGTYVAQPPTQRRAARAATPRPRRRSGR